MGKKEEYEKMRATILDECAMLPHEERILALRQRLKNAWFRYDKRATATVGKVYAEYCRAYKHADTDRDKIYYARRAREIFCAFPEAPLNYGLLPQ